MYNYFPEVFMKKFVLVIIIVLYLSSSLLVAAVDPAWYKITHSLGDWLSMGTKNLDDNPISNMYLGHYDINRAEGYENTTSWKNSNKIWDSQKSKLTFVLITTTPRARLEHVSKPNTTIDMSYEVNIGEDLITIANNTQTPTIATATMNYYLGSNINVSVIMPQGQHSKYRGDYTSFLTMQIYAEYGTDNQVLLKEFTYIVVVYFKKTEEPIITNLTINKYPCADNVNITNLQQGGAYLNVGSVNFWSNDTESTNSYSLQISPKINPLLGDFTFVHENSASSFTYKVHVPGRSTPNSKQFSVPVPPPAGNLAWNDFIEIAISSVYTPNILALGKYTSTIVIELVSNN